MGSKLKRFFYVASRKCLTVHRQYGRSHSEGRAACGRPISKGWFWAIHWQKLRRGRGRTKLRRCKYCERGMPEAK